MEKLRTWLSGWAALLSIMLAAKPARTAVGLDDFAEAPRPGPAEDSVWALIAGWREKARVKRIAAQLLGDCKAGLETFTEATVLSACADEAEKALVTWQEQEASDGA